MEEVDDDDHEPIPKAKPKAKPKDPPPAPPRPRREVGITSWSKCEKKTQVSMCRGCDNLIHVGKYRWAWRARKKTPYNQYDHITPACVLRCVQHLEHDIVQASIEYVSTVSDGPPEVVLAATEIAMTLS